MAHFFNRLLFLISFITGILIATIFKAQNDNDSIAPRKLFAKSKYDNWFKESKLIRHNIPFDNINKKSLSESQYLKSKIKILCIILVHKEKNVVAAKNTWALSCNEIQLIYLNLKRKIPVPIKKLGSQRPKSSWMLLCEILKHVPDHFHWILVVHDYSFVIMENLRLFVASLDWSKPYYLGHPVKFWNIIYNSGEAGYLLSYGALKVLQLHLNVFDSSLTYMNREDYYLGKILARLNITFEDTRDENDLTTFHLNNIYHFFSPEEYGYKSSVYPYKCCSPYSITFQSIESDKMYTYFYLLYTLRVYDEQYSSFKSTTLKPVVSDEVWMEFLKKRNVSTNITAAEYYRIWVNLVDDPIYFESKIKKGVQIPGLD